MDNKKITLNKKCISIPKVSDHPGISVIPIDNDIIEGYLILHGGEHQSFVKNHKICQQGFKINGKGNNNLGLKPLFLRFMGFDINLKNKLLSVKASREGVIHDIAFERLQNVISDLVLEYYSDNPSSLIPYMEEGLRNIITHRQNEYDFLCNNILYPVIDTKRNRIAPTCPLFAELKRKKESAKLLL